MLNPVGNLIYYATAITNSFLGGRKTSNKGEFSSHAENALKNIRFNFINNFKENTITEGEFCYVSPDTDQGKELLESAKESPHKEFGNSSDPFAVIHTQNTTRNTADPDDSTFKIREGASVTILYAPDKKAAMKACRYLHAARDYEHSWTIGGTSLPSAPK